MPTYNVSKFILRALNSIPVRDDIEVIIIDDASTDNTLDLIKDFWRDTELNMRVVHLHENRGLSIVMNSAYNLAQGEYFYQFDPDDWLNTENWEKALDELDGTDMVFVDAVTHEGVYYDKHDESNFNRCAAWFYFLRKDYLGDERRVHNVYGGDFEMYMSLISRPHSKKFTRLCAYNYNYPRVGSITWKTAHGEL